MTNGRITLVGLDPVTGLIPAQYFPALEGREGLYATDYGVIANGVADDTAALTAAIIAAQAEGCAVILPPTGPGESVLLSAPMPMLGACAGIIGAGRTATTVKVVPSSVGTTWNGSTAGFYGTVPLAPTASVLAEAGNLGVGTYRYRIAFQWENTNWGGLTIYETTHASAEVTVTTTSGSQQVRLSNVPTGPSGVTSSRLIYRTPVNGASGSEEYVGSIPDNTTTTWTDDVADAGLLAYITPVPISSYGRPIVFDCCGWDPSESGEYLPHVLKDFSLVGDTDLWGTNNQANMLAVDGIRLGSRDEVNDVTINGLYAGITIQGDHNNLYNAWSEVNAIGLRHTAPNAEDLGNNTFIACKFDINAFCSVSVQAGSTSQGDVYLETHMGFSPYAFFKEGVAPHTNQPLGEQFVDSSLFLMCFFEAVGNGAFYDPSLSSVMSNTTFVSCEGADFGPLEAGQTDVRVGSQSQPFSIASAPADWMVYVGVIAEVRVLGGAAFCPGNAGIWYAQSLFFDFYQDMARVPIDQINLSNATRGSAAGAAGNAVFAASPAAGQLSDVRCRYNTTECVIMPASTAVQPGDVTFVTSVDQAVGVSRSNSGTPNQPVAGVALSNSSSRTALSGIPIVRDGPAQVNLTAGLTLSASQSPGGWLKPTPNASDGTAAVAASQADYSLGYWTGGQNGTSAGIIVKLTGGGALTSTPMTVNFGTGADGAATLDGAAVPAGATLSAGVYTLTRDVQYSSLTINANQQVHTNGYRIFVAGPFSFGNNAQISNGGGNGTSGGGAGGGAIASSLGFGGGQGGAAGASAPAVTNALGSAGGAGAFASGAVTTPSTANGGSSPSPAQVAAPAAPYSGGSGGGGGASGAGGGGGGGGVVFIAAETITGNGYITARGGNGANGGGGGGGGLIYLAYETNSSTVTFQVNGGAGSGSGAAGSAGVVIEAQCVNQYDSGSIAQLALASTQTASSTVAVGMHNPFDATSGALVATLPSGLKGGLLVSLEKYDSGTNTVTVSGNIRGQAGATLVLDLADEQVLLFTDKNGSWWPIGGYKTLSSLDSRYTIAGATGPGLLPATVTATTQLQCVATTNPSVLNLVGGSGAGSGSYSYMGTATAAGALLTDSAVGDTVIASSAGSIRIGFGYGSAASRVQITPTQTTFSGTVVAPTPAAGDNSTKVATTAFVAAAVGGGNVNGGTP
jgi:hypothetical protein